MLYFHCENCGKEHHAEDDLGGRKGRCQDCGHVMRIPSVREGRHENPSARMMVHDAPPGGAAGAEPSRQALHREHQRPSHGTELARHSQFRLLDDHEEEEELLAPAVAAWLRQMTEFQHRPQGYGVASSSPGQGLLDWFRQDSSRPASWIHVRWRGLVNQILKVLRFINDWAYLIAVPFFILMLFALAIGNANLVHLGAITVLLLNLGRFWADLLAFFVRPFKESLIQGVAFLFPPYTLYYCYAHWDRMRPIVRRIGTSCIPILLVVVLYAFLPSVNPDVAGRKDLKSRLDSAHAELVKEEKHFVEDVNREIEELAGGAAVSESSSGKAAEKEKTGSRSSEPAAHESNKR